MTSYAPPTALKSKDFEARRGKYFDFSAPLLVVAPPPTAAAVAATPAVSLTAIKREEETRTSASTKSTGPGWYDMHSPEITPEVERDLRMIRLRSYFDPKQNWKRDDFAGKKLPEHFQIGTVIAGLGERTLKRRERHETITGEVLADESIRKVARKAFDQVAEKRASGGKREYARQQNRKRGRFNKKRFV